MYLSEVTTQEAYPPLELHLNFFQDGPITQLKFPALHCLLQRSRFHSDRCRKLSRS
jgi:hypothetical protein